MRIFLILIISLITLYSCSDKVSLKNGGTLEIRKNANGVITDSISYNKNQQLTGNIKMTDGDGTVTYTNYKNGVKEGDFKAFYNKGSLYYEGHYTNNKKSKVWKKYHHNGSIAEYKTYTPQGDLIYRRTYDELGKLLNSEGSAFMFINARKEDSIIYANDTLIFNMYISKPPNSIVKARTFLIDPNEEIVSAFEYTFEKEYITVEEYFDTTGIYKYKTLWILRDTVEKTTEKGEYIHEYNVKKGEVP